MSEKREQQYAEPQAYFDEQTPVGNLAAADRTELDRLRTAVKDADAVAAKATDWTARVRAEQDAKSLARELQAVEFNARLVLGGRQRVGQQASQPTSGFVVSDCGSAYLFVENTKKRRAPRTAVGVGVGTAQQFAEPNPPVSGA